MVIDAWPWVSTWNQSTKKMVIVVVWRSVPLKHSHGLITWPPARCGDLVVYNSQVNINKCIAKGSTLKSPNRVLLPGWRSVQPPKGSHKSGPWTLTYNGNLGPSCSVPLTNGRRITAWFRHTISSTGWANSNSNFRMSTDKRHFILKG